MNDAMKYLYFRRSDHRRVVKVPFTKPRLIPLENEERIYKRILRGFALTMGLAALALVWGSEFTSIPRSVLFFPALVIALVLYSFGLWLATRKYELA